MDEQVKGGGDNNNSHSCSSLSVDHSRRGKRADGNNNNNIASENNNNNNNNNGSGHGGVVGSVTTTSAAPCGACKFLRRKCVSGCIFAPHFGSDQGAARFAAVHKVFGASNVSKLLTSIPVSRRHDAAVTISYEAQARLSDPVYGCVSTIIALQQQVASLQGELSMVQTQLINSRFCVTNAFHRNNINSNALQNEQQQLALQEIALLQPSYSHSTSSASNNLIGNNNNNISNNINFNHNFGDTTAPSSNSFEPNNIHYALSSRSVQDRDDEDEEEISHALPLEFANNIFR